LKILHRHINSCGHYGESAFLLPIYGTCEIPQAFCRMSAVWGSTFILRRFITSLNCTKELVNVVEVADATERETSVISSANFNRKVRVSSVTDNTGKTFQCGAFVCSANYFPQLNKFVDGLILNCISISIGSILESDNTIAVIPPNFEYFCEVRNQIMKILNTHTIFVLQTGNSTSASPVGTSVLHITTMIESKQATSDVLWEEDAKENSAYSKQLIDNLMLMLQESRKNQSKYQELSRLITIQPRLNKLVNFENGDNMQQSHLNLPVNVAICGEFSCSMFVEDAFEMSHKIFDKLFPGQPFLVALPKTNEEVDEKITDNEFIDDLKNNNVKKKVIVDDETDYFQEALLSLK
jgi:hypothetical protein